MMIVSLFHWMVRIRKQEQAIGFKEEWETWFSSSLGVPIPTLIGPSQQCVMLGSGVHICILLVNSHTQGVQTVGLILMVL